MLGGVFRHCLIGFIAGVAHAQPVALFVNPSSREEVRQFYRTLYHASENVPMAWTGSYNPAGAGDTAAAYKEATRLRINFYRALVGVPADITLNATFNAKAQQAALLMSLNDALSHTPPPTWIGFNATAAEAAANSNLALGNAGPDAVSGYMADSGDNNAAVGHRRWLLYPQTLQMGTGDTPGVAGSAPRATNALWVFDGQANAPRPTTRTVAVPYPPAGFVPHPLVWPRWSFSHPDGDFSGATVTMTREGQGVPVKLEPISNGVGEPTLVWVYDDLDTDHATIHPRPARDTTYRVNVNNVRVRGLAQNFVYDVTVFDPDTPGSGVTPLRINGPALPSIGGDNRYTVTKPAFAAGLEWRTVRVSPMTETFTAESGLEGLLATTSAGYDVVQGTTVASGTRTYRLAQVSPRSDQVLRLPGTYLVDAGSALTFRSRLGIVTPIETARVQVSTDDGRTWMDLYSQSGSSPTDTSMPPPTEAGFVTRTLPLSAHASRTIALRFVYSAGPGIAFIPTPDNAVGWFIDDVTLTQAQFVTAGPVTRVNGDTFNFSPSGAGAVGLQARGVMFEAYPMEWGEVMTVTGVSGEGAAGHGYLANLSVRTNAGSDDQTLIVGFAVGGGTKPFLVRGAGPALLPFGVSNALTDPRLDLYRGTTRIAGNDDWLAADLPMFSRVGAFNFEADSRDSAVVIPLAAGSYTAQVSGAGGGTGVALVELYDGASTIPGTKLTNVSARSQIGAGNELLIAGFSIAGTHARTLLIRAVGPTLRTFGVDAALADPKLELYAGNSRLDENDNWNPSVRPAFEAVGAFQLETDSRDAALLVTLPPGSYTAQVSGVNGAAGVALVEIYEVR